MRFLFIYIVILIAVQPLGAQTLNTDYKVYDVAASRECSLQEIIDRTGPGQVLVFGEQHDDSVGHLLEKAAFEALYRKFGSNSILSMEMFHRDVQYIVDEYLAGLISEKNFVKEARAWDTYSTDYRPVVAFAKEKGLAVVAANAPSRYTNMVTRGGLEALSKLDKHVRKQYIAPLPIDTLTGDYYSRFLETMGGHTMPGMHLYQSQNFWDATMAWSISRILKKHSAAVVFMMNGRFHSDYHSGLVQRLATGYKRKVKTISCFKATDFEVPQWSDYRTLADFIILTK